MNPRNTSHRKYSFIALGVTAAFAISSCGGNAQEGGGNDVDQITEVNMGYVPWIGYGGWYVSEEQGIFEEEGLKVDFTLFNTDAEKNNAIAAGQIDALNIASHGALQLLQEGIDVSIVLLMDVSTTADAIAVTGDIESLSDLEGESVAYEEITTSDVLLNYALASEGMTIEDIDPVPMAASSAGSALMGGQVPVAVTYEPYLSEAMAADEDVNLLYTAGEAPGLISDVLVVRNEFIDENPDAVQALVDSWSRSMEFYEANTDESQEIIADFVGSDIDSLRTAFDGVEFFNGEDNAAALTGEFVDTIMPIVQEGTIGAGIIEGEVDYEAAINSEFVEQSAQ